MFRNLWEDYLTDPDFFIPAMFICMSIDIVLRFLYWNRKPGWTVWSATLLLDMMIGWIVICSFVQAYVWRICWPTLPMGIWGAIPYTVFLCFYYFRRKKTTEPRNMLENVADCELEHVHNKLGDLIKALRYVPKEQKLYWDLIQFQDRILDEEMRRV